MPRMATLWGLPVLAMGVVLLVTGGALSYPALDRAWHTRPFDAAAWRAARHHSGGNWPPRLRMVDDLVARQPLLGLTHAQVVAMLGPPDDVAKFRELSRRSDDAAWDAGYELGPERGAIMRIDNEWLLFDLDANGRVQRVAVLGD